MGIYNEVALRKVPLVAGQACAQTMAVHTGAGGAMVVVLASDAANGGPMAPQPGKPEVTTSITTIAGQWLPISIVKYVSGPADAVGFAV